MPPASPECRSMTRRLGTQRLSHSSIQHENGVYCTFNSRSDLCVTRKRQGLLRDSSSSFCLLFPNRHSLLFRLFIARQDVIRPLPWRQKVEVPKFLLELHRLIDDALRLVVVAHFDEAGQRKVLA